MHGRRERAAKAIATLERSDRKDEWDGRVGRTFIYESLTLSRAPHQNSITTCPAFLISYPSMCINGSTHRSVICHLLIYVADYLSVCVSVCLFTFTLKTARTHSQAVRRARAHTHALTSKTMRSGVLPERLKTLTQSSPVVVTQARAKRT